LISYIDFSTYCYAIIVAYSSSHTLTSTYKDLKEDIILWK